MIYSARLFYILRHGIIPGTAPPRITRPYPLRRKPRTFKKTVFLQCLNCILRTGWRISTRRVEVWRYRQLVEPHQKQRNCYRRFREIVR